MGRLAGILHTPNTCLQEKVGIAAFARTSVDSRNIHPVACFKGFLLLKLERLQAQG